MFLKRFQNWLYTEVGSSDYRIFRSFYLKAKKNLSQKETISDRIHLLMRVIGILSLVRFKRYTHYENYIIDDPANLSLRKKYIARYDNSTDCGLIEKNFKSVILLGSLKDLYHFLPAYFGAVIRTFIIILSPVNFSLLQLSNYFLLKIKLSVLKPSKIYIFYSYLPHSYLISLYAANHKVKVDYIVGNMIYENLRYAYYTHTRICFTNVLYKEEYQTFQKTGWIRENDVDHIVSGNELLIQRSKKSPLYDIGFFSSAYWARKEGLYADNNIAALKESQYENNLYAKREYIILKHLVCLVKENQWRFKIYLHPYERKLILEHGIYPPYWQLLEENGLLPDISDLKKNNDFFEAKVGILLQSSIFYDRWENGLYTLCYQFKDPKNRLQIPLKYLGSYADYGFKNLKELTRQITRGLLQYEK